MVESHKRAIAAAGPEARRLDGDLMQRIASRDPQALGLLYARHSDRVLSICLAVLRDRTEAEEAVGDVFFQLWRIAHRFDAERGTPAAFLATLARSRALDRARRIGRLRRQRADALEGERAWEPSPEPEPDEDERLPRVRRALARLAAPERRLLELAFERGLTQTQIASEFGVPLGTVKSRMRRLLLRLRGTLVSSQTGGVGGEGRG